MSWVLVIYIYAGLFFAGPNDKVEIMNINGFHSQASCEAAGQQSEVLVKGTSKSSRFMCLEVK